jgi:hypothetical protein
MCVGVLPLLPQPIEVQLGEGNLWTHENDQFATLLATRCGTECGANEGYAREIRKAFIALLLLVFN